MTAQRREAEAENRVLALDPTSRGLGFAVLEGAARLIDWGTKDAGRADSDLALRHVTALLDHYSPDTLVVEDVRGSGSRRCKRVRDLIGSVETIAAERRVTLERVSRGQVQQAFGTPGAATKQQIAAAIAEHFPELVPRLPPRRKAWMSEDERMSIFDAVAFALTFYYLSESTTSSHESRKQDQVQPEAQSARD